MYDGCSSSLGMWRSHRLHIEFCTHKFPCAAAALFFQLSPFLGPRVCTACFVMNYTWIEQTGLRVVFVGDLSSRRFQCLVFFQCSGQIVFCLKVINMQTKVFDAVCEWIRSCGSMHFSCRFFWSGFWQDPSPDGHMIITLSQNRDDDLRICPDHVAWWQHCTMLWQQTVSQLLCVRFPLMVEEFFSKQIWW